MSETPETTRWKDQYRYRLRALLRDAARYRRLTMETVPPEFAQRHLDYMLRPAFVGQLMDTVTDLGTGVYQTELQARYQRHRPEDQDDLTIARQHLSQAARHLARIQQRGKRSKP